MSKKPDPAVPEKVTREDIESQRPGLHPVS